MQARAIWQSLQSMDPAQHRAEFEARNPLTGDAGARKPYELRQDGVAIFGASGVMTKKPTSFGGGLATTTFRSQLRAALKDPDCKGALVVVDSPGGLVNGTQELADDVAAFAAKKPITIFIDDQCFSAAYWGFSTATRIVMNASGFCGNMGILAVLYDTSKAAEAAGVECLIFKTGPLKGAGTPGSVITDEQQAEFQAMVDTYGQNFVNTVAKGRKMKRDDVRALFTGGIFSAKDALANGLIDAIGTLDSATAEVLAQDDETGDSFVDELSGARHLKPATFAEWVSGSKPIAVAVTGETTTISGQPGSTDPQGTGESRTSATSPGSGAKQMKNPLIRALAAFKLGRMATAVTMSNSEDPEALASVMAEQVDAEVSDRIANHPLMQACHANNIKEPAQLVQVLEMKALGEQYLTELRADASAEATRAHGELGPQIAAQVATMPASSVKAVRDAWRTEADAKYGIGKNGEAATRQTAVSGAVSVDAEDKVVAKSNWERLTDPQKAHAANMGLKTDAEKESFATNVLANTTEVK